MTTSQFLTYLISATFDIVGPFDHIKIASSIIYAFLAFIIYDLPNCSFLNFCHFSFFQRTSYIWVCSRILPSAYSSQNVDLSLILVISNISTCMLTNPNSISLGHIIFQRNSLYFQLSIGHIFPDVPQVTPFQHVQNITFIFTQVKLFLYKPTPPFEFPISGNENNYPTICSSQNFEWHLCQIHLLYPTYWNNP